MIVTAVGRTEAVTVGRRRRCRPRTRTCACTDGPVPPALAGMVAGADAPGRSTVTGTYGKQLKSSKNVIL